MTSEKTYQVWAKGHELEYIKAVDSFTARKEFAARHGLAVSDCASQVAFVPPKRGH
jgi:hypothetical protein